VPALHRLIQELAVYERAGELVTVSAEARQQHFDNGQFEFLVAERDGAVLGISLFFFRYSTWRGRLLYLEDLIVTETARGQAIGKALFEATIEAARTHGAVGMVWQVLEWNEPSIKFYKKYGAEFSTEWIECKLKV
jgi:GNAT superfamily N-acetyltransferase